MLVTNISVANVHAFDLRDGLPSAKLPAAWRPLLDSVRSRRVRLRRELGRERLLDRRPVGQYAPNSAPGEQVADWLVRCNPTETNTTGEN
jgi:hypothetical protein